MLNPEEAEKIKEQLYAQIATLPEERRAAIQQKIEDMSPEELEEFIEQNTAAQENQKCIFCSIIAGQIPAYKIDEDEDNIAVLEINPLSKSHCLVIPKDHASKDPDPSHKLALKISDKIKQRLNPKEVKISATKIMSHPMLEIIPLYGGEKERKKATESELKELQEILTKPEPKPEPKSEVKPEEKKTETKEEPVVLPKLRPRIP